MAVDELDDMDIARDASIVLQNAHSVAKAILERRAEMDREGKQDQPLVVISGECALMPAHAIDLIATLDILKDKEKVSLGYEHAHDAVQKGFSRATGAPLEAKQADYLREHDKSGAVTLKYSFDRLIEPAHKALLSFLLEQNIPTRFTDASSQGQGFYSRSLNKNDPSTSACLRACFGGEPISDIAPEAPEGFRVRNRHMAEQALNFAKAGNARIIIQLCGNFHVIGRDPHFPACDSVTANFKALGASVLAMPRLMQDFQERDIPVDHGLSAKELLPIKGLPETRIDMNSGPETSTKDAHYAESLMDHCSLGAARLTPVKHSSLKQQYATDVAQVFEACEKISSRQQAQAPLKKFTPTKT